MTERNNPMMGCGHAANATDSDGNPVCVICVGLDPLAKEIVEGPDLSERLARCTYYGCAAKGRNREGPCNGTWKTKDERCMCEVPSSTNLAFFSYRPDKNRDAYFCGCWGWD